ncbi:PucR family transcriptional regulator [Nocardia thailandica]
MTDSVLPTRIATVAGRPVTECLPAASVISGRVMSRFVVGSDLPGRIPLAVLRRDVTAMVTACLDLLARLLRGDAAAEPPAGLAAGVMEWAHAGVPVDTLHRVVRESLGMAFEHCAAQAETDRDRAVVAAAAPSFVELSLRLAPVISCAYLNEVRVTSGDVTDAVADALVTGTAVAATARARGVRLAASYLVFVLDLAPREEEPDPHPDRRIAADRTARRVRAEVLRACGDRVLMRLDGDGGVLLVDRDHFDPAGAEEFVDRLTAAARTRIRATFVHADVEGVPEAVERGKAVLEIMRRLRLVGLQRFEELSLEYQLTRPGTAARHLAALLDPLDAHPVLLDTLAAHLASRATRLSTARALHVHPNTIDYRLNRIAEITGLDPLRADGLWRIRSALVARRIGVEPREPDEDTDTPTAAAC